MNEINKHIRLAEKKWLDQLYNYCKELFNAKELVSHDHTHHLRVWEYSKEILQELAASFEISYDLLESCLIASLFHDTGLSRVLGEKHGMESRNICVEYFENNNLPKPKSFEGILVAIENHDDKDYKLTNNKPNSILAILCNADDLDAFGKIGIDRYKEIYLLREIHPNKLPVLVIKNLDKRFANFEHTYKDFTDLFEKHKLRYLLTRSYFENLEKEIT